MISGKAELFIDRARIGEVQNIEVEREYDESTYKHRPSVTSGSFTLTNVKHNFKMMSPKMRTWCKSMNLNGKLYI